MSFRETNIYKNLCYELWQVSVSLLLVNCLLNKFWLVLITYPGCNVNFISEICKVRSFGE